MRPRAARWPTRSASDAPVLRRHIVFAVAPSFRMRAFVVGCAVLSGKQRRYLRSLGHHLEPVVQVGKEGISERLVGALDAALRDHELIKLKLAESVAGDRHQLAAELARAAGAELAQVLGRTVLLYRRREEEPRIVLP